MKTFNTNAIKVEDGTMTKLNDAQLSEVAGGSSEITAVRSEQKQKQSDLPAADINYGNMQFADQQQFGAH